MAAWEECQGDYFGISDGAGVPTIKCLEPLFLNIVQSITALVGVAFFVMLLVGGFSFLFSSGDPKKLQQAKGTIGLAFAGIVIVVCAFLIIKLIESFTGINTLHIFNIDPTPP
jgi:hypothetical protein